MKLLLILGLLLSFSTYSDDHLSENFDGDELSSEEIRVEDTELEDVELDLALGLSD